MFCLPSITYVKAILTFVLGIHGSLKGTDRSSRTSTAWACCALFIVAFFNYKVKTLSALWIIVLITMVMGTGVWGRWPSLGMDLLNPISFEHYPASPVWKILRIRRMWESMIQFLAPVILSNAQTYWML